MHPTAEQPATQNPRHEALIAAMRASGRSDAPELLAKHPHAPALLRRWKAKPGRSVREALIWELQQSEARWMPGEAQSPISADLPDAAFWLRRKRLAHLLSQRQQIHGLPRLWQALATLPAAQVQALCQDLGVHAVASVAGHAPREIFDQLLRPLGDELAGLARAVIEAHPGIKTDKETNAILVRFYLELAQHSLGAALVRRFGRCVIAVCFRALPSESVRLLTLYCRTNLINSISATELPAEIAPAVLEAAELLLRDRVRTLVSKPEQIE
jgi:hypothetical protein